MGCSSSTNGANSGVDAGPAPGPCEVGTHGAPGHCETTLAMAQSDRALTPVRDHHGTVVVETDSGPYLYVLGGTDA